MTVRPATPEDAEAITRLHVASWLAHYRGILPDEVLDGLSYDERLAKRRGHLEHPVPGIENLVLEVDGRVLGWSAFGPVRAEGNADLGLEAGELYAIYLDPAEVGRGHGRTLWLAVLDAIRARDWTEIVLWVLTGNRLARRFYEAAGFTVDARVPETPHHGAMALRLCRDLP